MVNKIKLKLIFVQATRADYQFGVESGGAPLLDYLETGRFSNNNPSRRASEGYRHL